MSKAFVKEDGDDADDDLDPAEAGAAALPGGRNYITREGYERLKSELLQLIDVERPEVVRVVSWAASNGDRSENGDYLYGKKRLREIDRRIRFLTKRLDAAEVVERGRDEHTDQVFFGATVTYLRNGEHEETIRIVGIDEVDPSKRWVSWISPVAKALLKAREGDVVTLRTPAGMDELEVTEVRY
ncbi:MAG: transcription elongation factor GreB [Burkholderiales bacterium]|nr:transcription elongation factor GreB [Burkholderiales bacterium]ODU67052.1 MAG: transcription elongation factor GreB [Lautropia sp. SCN 66-9]